MAAAARADPELVRRPRHARTRVAHVHLRATALTPDLQVDVAHGRDSSLSRSRPADPRTAARPATIHHRMIPAIVLAAGKSTRMGRAKALLPLERDETFLTRIIATLKAADVEDVVVVVGHDAPAIIAAFDRGPVTARVVVNPNYEA